MEVWPPQPLSVPPQLVSLLGRSVIIMMTEKAVFLNGGLWHSTPESLEPLIPERPLSLNRAASSAKGHGHLLIEPT